MRFSFLPKSIMKMESDITCDAWRDTSLLCLELISIMLMIGLSPLVGEKIIVLSYFQTILLGYIVWRCLLARPMLFEELNQLLLCISLLRISGAHQSEAECSQ
jgi:hypothetical protein